MRRKLGRSEVLALLAMAGISAGVAEAANIDASKQNQSNSLQVIEQPAATQLGSGKDSACGKGACGTDESGAKAAQQKHSAGTKKTTGNNKTVKNAAKKTNKKSAGK